MAILSILRWGDDRLLRKALPLTLPADPTTRRLATDMVDTMIAADGAGLAAPQVGISVRLIVFHIPPERIADEPNATVMTPIILCNPAFTTDGSEQEESLEGCLSMPGLRGVVPRWRRIIYQGHSLDGTALRVKAEGFHARVVQHECDHLDGVLFFQHIQDMQMIGYRQEIEERLSEQTDIRQSSAGSIA